METQELLKRIKRVEVKAKGLSKQLFAGNYHSAFKGLGMEFAEVRQYFPGDETRTIDWNVTARFNEPFVKTFEEERELTVMFLIDVSASTLLGSKHQSKKDYLIELCATLAFSAIQNNDKVGALFFSDEVEKYVPPRKGKQHVLRIIRDMVEIQPQQKGTNIAAALDFFTHAMKRHCTAFLVSDFSDLNYERSLRLAGRKHDLMALRVLDPMDLTLPNWGWKYMQNIESGKGKWVNFSAPSFRKRFELGVAENEHYFKNSVLKAGVSGVNFNTAEPFIAPLQKAFKQRGR